MENDELTYEILPDDYPSYDLSFKIIIIGNSGVGKSCLAVKATKNIFENHYLATVGFEFFTFNLRMMDKVIKLQIWDTCGQEIYRSLITNFYRNSSLAIIVYAIDDYTSFEDVEMWLKEIKTNSNPDVKVFLIGNKVDLEDKRKIPIETAQRFKEDYGIDLFLETSAKSGFNAKTIFIEAGKILFKDYMKYKLGNDTRQNSITTTSDQLKIRNYSRNSFTTMETNKNSDCKC